MWHVFGLKGQNMLYKFDEKENSHIMEQIMIGGNLGRYDERLKTNKGQGKFSAITKILKHNLHLLSHYPADVIWAPMWIGYHWCWKRYVR